MREVILLAICIVQSLTEDVVKVTAGDSYLEAYRQTSIASEVNNAEKKNDVNYPVYSSPSSNYGAPDHYNSLENHYARPVSQYGTPPSQYGSSAPQYELPAPQYGPPPVPPPSYGSFGEPVPAYGPPAAAYGPPAQNLQVFYGMPHAMISIWDKLWEKFKWKLNILTLGKIILKLVIFKKIVGFIAIICLLLFIPSLKNKKFGSGEDETDRSLSTKITVDGSLNNLFSFVMQAIEMYSNNNQDKSQSCATTYCRARKVLNQLDQQSPTGR